MAILYVETNLVMSIAMGRDAEAEALVREFPSANTLVLPAICVMECFSASQRERSGHNDLAGKWRQQANEIERDRSSPAAAALIALLRQAAIEAGRLNNDIQQRLTLTIHELISRATLIPVETAVVTVALQVQHVKQLTDNLILHSVLGHAAGQPRQPMAFLTGNTNDFMQPQIRATLAAGGIADVWSTARQARRWLADIN